MQEGINVRRLVREQNTLMNKFVSSTREDI
ncbi:MAG: hypothetical protein DVB28_001167 [Verrucomicrobia bacterium]|nr:MAG: hypothetical protein DVB28_001167 [Verrucomicrobiota bacterium]